MSQKIILTDASLIYFSTILIWIYVILENNSHRKIKSCRNHNFKTLGKNSYHKVTYSDMTNNICESLYSFARKRIGFLKPIQFIIDFCFLNDSEQMSKKGEKKKKLLIRKIFGSDQKLPKSNIFKNLWISFC